MTMKEMDAKCNALFRKLDDLKARGADKEKGGEYDRVLYELRDLTKARAHLSTYIVESEK